LNEVAERGKVAKIFASFSSARKNNSAAILHFAFEIAPIAVAFDANSVRACDLF